MAEQEPAEGLDDTMRGTRMRPHSKLAVAAVVLAVAVAVLAMLSGLGSRWGWWHFRTGFTLLRYAVYGAIAVVVVGLAAAIHARPGGPRRGLPSALFAIAVGAVMILIPLQWRARAREVPPIHDITTDTENPPAFVALAPVRADAPNGVEYRGAEIAERQRRAYPDIQSVRLDAPPAEAFEQALAAARDMNWEIVAADARAGRIEATDRTFWFGFYDDVVIRIAPDGAGSQLDIRSMSRVGGSDVGTNARRIRAYLEELLN